MIYLGMLLLHILLIVGRGPLKANFQRSMLSVLCNNCLVVYRWVPINVELAHGSCPAASIFCGASLG